MSLIFSEYSNQNQLRIRFKLFSKTYKALQTLLLLHVQVLLTHYTSLPLYIFILSIYNSSISLIPCTYRFAWLNATRKQAFLDYFFGLFILVLILILKCSNCLFTCHFLLQGISGFLEGKDCVIIIPTLIITALYTVNVHQLFDDSIN